MLQMISQRKLRNTLTKFMIVKYYFKKLFVIKDVCIFFSCRFVAPGVKEIGWMIRELSVVAHLHFLFRL